MGIFLKRRMTIAFLITTVFFLQGIKLVKTGETGSFVSVCALVAGQSQASRCLRTQYLYDEYGF